MYIHNCATTPHLELIAIDLLLLKQHIGHLVQHANVGLDEVLCAPAYHHNKVSKVSMINMQLVKDD